MKFIKYFVTILFCCLHLNTAKAQLYLTKPLEKGTASYYSELFHYCQTSNGEVFHMDSLTAAHVSLKPNTYLKVTNKRSGKWVIVRVNDRMPQESKHSLDLALGAYKQIGRPFKGFMPVEISLVFHPDVSKPPTFNKWFLSQKKRFYKNPAIGKIN